ncbi:MAG: NYN domain-containing protein, partial [Pararhizobium sp.]
MIRSSFFIDGFNFYHALRRLDEPHLKWVDLRALMKRQTMRSEAVTAIYYFSAYASWLPGPHARHRQYVVALEQRDVTVVMGHFKKKDRYCQHCRKTSIGHEEKETDVNLALCLLNEAYKDTYDRAYIVSRDSDLKPAMAMVRNEFPQKELFVVAPP